jgi:hypothetical protein
VQRAPWNETWAEIPGVLSLPERHRLLAYCSIGCAGRRFSAAAGAGSDENKSGTFAEDEGSKL